MAEPQTPKPDGLESVENRVASMLKELAELKILMAKERKVRWATIGAILFVIAIVVMMGYNLFVTNLDPKKIMPLVAARTPKLVEDTSDEFIKGMQEILPEVQAEVEKIISERAPKIMATAQGELDHLVTNLDKEIAKQIESQLKAIERDLRATLSKEFPELTDAKVAVMVANFEKAVVSICTDYAHDYFQKHAAHLLDIEKTLQDERFKAPADLPKGEELMQEIRGTLVQLFQLKLVQMVDTDASQMK